MKKKLILFSDHMWFFCYEHQVDEIIKGHTFTDPAGIDKYAMVYSVDGLQYERIDINE